MKNFMTNQGVGCAALVVAAFSAYYGCRQRDAADEANEQTKKALNLAENEAVANKKRDRANASVVIQTAYKDVLTRAEHDCTVRAWLEDPCVPPRASLLSERDRDIWLRDLLMWMELVYVQTATLDDGAARAWRTEVQSYFKHPEICDRALARLNGNRPLWEDVFWTSIPPECRGSSLTVPSAAATSASLSIKDLKVKWSVSHDER
jgi:hypothetical protein